MMTLFALIGFILWAIVFVGLVRLAAQAGENDVRVFLCILLWPVTVLGILLWEPLGWLLRKVRP